jgi:hypothetical protein
VTPVGSQDQAVHLALRAAYAGLMRKSARVGASEPSVAGEARTCWSRGMKESGFWMTTMGCMRMRRRSEFSPLYLVLVRADEPLAEERQVSARDSDDVGGESTADARQSRPRPKDADLRRARLAQSGDLIRAAAKRTFASETPRAERDSGDCLLCPCREQQTNVES